MIFDIQAMGAFDMAFGFISAWVTLAYVWRLDLVSLHSTRWPFIAAHFLGMIFAAAVFLDTLDGQWDREEIVGIALAMVWLWASAGHWRHGLPRYARIRPEHHEAQGEFTESRLP